MVDWQDRLFQDSVLVRFEDGKLNPRATFTALAAFLDLPYTQSMTYCSRNGERDPESLKGNDRGFDPAAIYRTYEDYLGREERVYLEYLMGDVYQRYGYDFQYYDGAPMDEAAMDALIGQLHGCTDLILASYKKAFGHKAVFKGEGQEEWRQELLAEAAVREQKRRTAEFHAPIGAGPGPAGTAALSLRRTTWNTREPFTFSPASPARARPP